MTKQSYRVIQWTTGNVCKVALRRFIENPMFELTSSVPAGPVSDTSKKKFVSYRAPVIDA